MHDNDAFQIQHGRPLLCFCAVLITAGQHRVTLHRTANRSSLMMLNAARENDSSDFRVGPEHISSAGLWPGISV